MRLMLSMAAAMLGALPQISVSYGDYQGNIKAKDSPQPHRHSGVRAARRHAAKRRNQRRGRK